MPQVSPLPVDKLFLAPLQTDKLVYSFYVFTSFFVVGHPFCGGFRVRVLDSPLAGAHGFAEEPGRQSGQPQTAA